MSVWARRIFQRILGRFCFGSRENLWSRGWNTGFYRFYHPSFFGVSFRLKGTGLLVLKGRIMLDHIFFNILLHCWWISPWHGFVSNWGISQNCISWKVTIHHWMLGDFWALYPIKKHDFISSLKQLSWENDENPLKPLDFLGFQVWRNSADCRQRRISRSGSSPSLSARNRSGRRIKKITALNR